MNTVDNGSLNGLGAVTEWADLDILAEADEEELVSTSDSEQPVKMASPAANVSPASLSSIFGQYNDIQEIVI